MSGLEPRGGPKVVMRRIDSFVASKRRHDFSRSVTQAERSHRDERAVVGPERRAKVQFEDAIRSEKEPVRARARQNDASKARTFEIAARQRDGPTRAMRHGTDVLWHAHLNVQRHQQLRVHVRSLAARRAR